MIESDIMRLVQIEASRSGFRLFRNNVGTGWCGKSIRINKPSTVNLLPGDVVIRQARPLHAGLCTGSSDLIGWSPSGLFAAAEIKTDSGGPSEEQKIFIDAVNSSGGVAGIVRSVEDFKRVIIK